MLTIVTESSLERTLSRDLEVLGANGYTITDARGKGARGARDGEWQCEGNIRIEVVCKANLAEAIMAHMSATYFDNFAMIIYSHDVTVLRTGKF